MSDWGTEPRDHGEPPDQGPLDQGSGARGGWWRWHLHFGRPRTSTVVLTVLFLGVLALWITVRPVPPASTGTAESGTSDTSGNSGTPGRSHPSATYSPTPSKTPTRSPSSKKPTPSRSATPHPSGSPTPDQSPTPSPSAPVPVPGTGSPTPGASTGGTGPAVVPSAGGATGLRAYCCGA